MIKYLKFFVVFLFSLLPLASYSYAEIEIVPIIDADIVGGQYVFVSTYPASGALGGNINVDVTPAISFGEKFSFLPTISYNYYGIKDVTELVGGGTLFQQRLDLLGNGKLIYSISDKLKIKGGGSYKAEYLIETSTEAALGWGNGLFDYTKWTAGGEIETILNDKGDSLRAGYNFYHLSFTNYEALVSKYGDYFQELQQKPGAKVLDYNASEIFVDGGIQFSDNFMSNYNFTLTFKSFSDQYIIDSFGTYSSTDTRNDSSPVHNISVLFLLPLKEDFKLLANLGFQFNTYKSDQNHYDVSRFKYILNYYGYSGFRISPSVSLYFGSKKKPLIVIISTAFANRNYSKRLTQDSSGNYGMEKIYTKSIIAGVSASFPIAEGISLRAQFNYLNKFSNMEYEAFYKYNYSTMNYFAGLSISF